MLDNEKKATLKEAEEPVFRVKVPGTNKEMWLSESLLAILEGVKNRKKGKETEEKTVPSKQES